jgi:hypothetical protein
MSHDNITSDQSIWEYNMSAGFDSFLDGIHCLLFKMGKSLVLAYSLKPIDGLLIPWSSSSGHYCLSSSHTHVSCKTTVLLIKRPE